MTKFFFALAALSITACSTFSKKECESMDWYQSGFTSARQGDTVGDGLAYYQRKCTDEHGIAVNGQRFQEGYDKGLQYFCTEGEARLFGQTGKQYRGTCPKDKESAFTKNYDSGRMDYLIQRVKNLEQEISNLESQISYKDSEISALRSQVCH